MMEASGVFKSCETEVSIWRWMRSRSRSREKSSSSGAGKNPGCQRSVTHYRPYSVIPAAGCTYFLNSQNPAPQWKMRLYTGPTDIIRYYRPGPRTVIISITKSLSPRSRNIYPYSSAFPQYRCTYHRTRASLTGKRIHKCSTGGVIVADLSRGARKMPRLSRRKHYRPMVLKNLWAESA